MSRFVTGIQVWNEEGGPRWTASIRDGRAGDVRANDDETIVFGGEGEETREARAELVRTLTPHVARALAGHTFSTFFDRGDQTVECFLAPLRDAQGRAAGAVTVMIDATERRRIEETLRQRLAFQDLITHLSTRFASLPVDAIHGALHDALRAIGEFTQVDRVYIFRFVAGGTAMDNTHEWCAAGIEPQIENLQGITLEALPWWAARLRGRELINVPDIHQLPEEASAEKSVLLEQDIKSVLALPMTDESSVVGFIGFDSVRHSKIWPEEDVGLLRIASEIFVSALHRVSAEEGRRHLEAQLVQARSMENIARLAGGVAHDFNNLLAVILNYSKILERELTDPGQRDKVTELYETARRAADLTRQLLLVGRRDVVAPILLDLNQVLEPLGPLLLQMLGESVELRLSLASDLELVKVGVPQIEQVIVNLTINARDAMPRGGVLEIETKNTNIEPVYAARYIDLQPGRYVLLRVSDSGTGMPPDVAARAFEPFFTTKRAGGTGLGLSTVHGIVKQAGGHIALSSVVGKGTTIDIYLPIIDGVATPSSAPASSPSAKPPLGRGETILVVEDSEALRKLVCRMLDNNRYRAIEATTPDEALALCERQPGGIDLLLTDVIMPQMSGRELATRVRERCGVTRVLYMSGYDAEIVAHHGVLQEGTHLLQKPFLEADLLYAVRKVLDERRR